MLKSPYEVDYSQRKSAKADNMFTQRWSPRAFEKFEIPNDHREKIFDATRWSPSCYAEEPWRIFASKNDPKDFEKFLKLLTDTNQAWAKNTSIIGFFIAKKHFTHNGKSNDLGLFDCGFVWAALTYQANMLGYYTHCMAGINYEEIIKTFQINKDTFKVVVGFAIGKIAKPDANNIPDWAKDKEKPSGRKPLNEIYFEGGTTDLK